MKISLRCSFSLILPYLFSFANAESALSLPPPTDMPEEVLRTEIIIEARSPIDGKPLTASEYAQMQAQQESVPSQLSPNIQHLVFLARVRKLIRRIVPLQLKP